MATETSILQNRIADFVQALPPELVDALAELSRRGKLNEILLASLNQVLLKQVAGRYLADVVRTNIAPVIQSTLGTLRRVGTQTETTTTGSVSDVQRITRRRFSQL